MPKKYPPLTRAEVANILKAHGFTLIGVEGSHYHYKGTIKGKARRVPVSKHAGVFDARMIKNMIDESGLGYKDFYCATKVTAKKINAKPIIITD
jgi:predicted RNA binding protein YcfA (HicA-like mRNA interferase family)